MNMTNVNPVLTEDEVERLFISDAPTEGTLRLEDCGIDPVTLEGTLMRFVKLYIPPEFQRMPLEQYLKKVAPFLFLSTILTLCSIILIASKDGRSVISKIYSF